MSLYTYSGPVLYYDKVIANNWRAETHAESRAKAVNNVKYQFKNYNNMIPSTGVLS